MTECRCWHDIAATQCTTRPTDGTGCDMRRSPPPQSVWLPVSAVATTRWHIRTLGTTLLAAVQAADTVLSQSLGERRLRPPACEDKAAARWVTLSRKERGSRLIQAAKQGAVGEMQALFTAGADVGARGSEGTTALHWAAVEGRVEVVRCLVEGGAHVDARSNSQNTPLHTAARNGHAAVVRLLVAASADLNARNEDGQTPLHRAAFYGHPEVVAVLLEAGADKGARMTVGPPNVISPGRKTISSW
ncbi:serine/threonine-protein phosphatase 6 regulatory ankyrin repeat subunit C-like [Schistocerca nitens]|uniref:serine/threonine-protein phosphatase 6 regulatory ankyrin repeat subunit C-like n=1 Tax=Schistocerca nitens TaxID=7011 RepID=UPI002117C99C|nr:serine/threonine-protein phosphatase 6 regulatory ankyrin repeat subunit C-like [Schistocerca nitens]